MERNTVTISGSHLLRQYNELKDKGYTTLWTGEGKICLIAPDPSTPLPPPPTIFTEQKGSPKE